MNAIIFKFGHQAYSQKNFLGNHLDPLSHFLTDMYSIEYCRKWFYSSDLTYTVNESHLERHPEDLIKISFLDFPEICFLTNKNFLQLLDQWEYICRKNIPTAILYEENGGVHVAPYEETA